MASRQPDGEPTCPVDLYFDLDMALTAADHHFTAVPSAETIVSSMPTVSEGGVCTVCMEEFEEGKRMPCCHVYHAVCISSWLALDSSCPLCRCRIYEAAAAEGVVHHC